MTVLEWFGHFDLMEIVSAGLVLFAVIDIVGGIPIILDLKRKSEGELSAFKASWVSLVIMISFLFLGKSILNLIGINIESFAVAGALVIFFIALEMVLGIDFFREDEHAPKKASSVVPLAFPLIAGAGTMTTIVSLKAEFQEINIAIAILINIVVVYFVIKLSGLIEKVIGAGGIHVLKKIFGVILLAMAIKLFTTNIKELW